MHKVAPQLNSVQQAQVAEIADRIRYSEHVVAMTGAGMSVESGIPPFRGTGGLWTKHGIPPMDGYAQFKKDPTKWWSKRVNEEIDGHINELRHALNKAEPHSGHYALAELANGGDIDAVITQNIDGLDEKVGIENLIEIHGNRQKLRCIECNDRVSLGDFVPLFIPDPCKHCGGVVKFDTVMFGEPIPPDVMDAAKEEIERADCVLAIGTSATVRPASGLIWIAEAAGATILEINPADTKITDISEISLRATAGAALTSLAAELN